MHTPPPRYIFSGDGCLVGGVLQVWRDRRWEAAEFFSKQLQRAQQRYSATELETLALVSTVEHFAYYLYGRQFKAFTDHKPLVHLMTSDRLNPWLRRMAFKMQHWLVTIEYLPGKDNTTVPGRETKNLDAGRSSRPGRQSRVGGCGGRSPT